MGLRLSGELTTKEIMRMHGIQNKSQIETWMRCYRNNEFYRFDQQIGKQYTFGYGPEYASENDNQKRQLSHLKMDIKKRLKKVVLQIVEKFKGKYTINAILSVLEVPRANYYRWCAEGIKKLVSGL
ncbi:helix-turn-helix domain-containing protein [Sporosarcina sp. G11-34]|uniref:helix-turn-helix domain-containing protein n=1 Tax=Sporosarcina sp. G11-34 TaxID=2849605 RepID=UPI0022A96DFC|nr:helix-turn-helix domain-containing protein [Sporosarcina sp. G11-34]MCZ2257579.1 hypothetical protein [Sporosarcina sp. G11-34]